MVDPPTRRPELMARFARLYPGRLGLLQPISVQSVRVASGFKSVNCRQLLKIESQKKIAFRVDETRVFFGSPFCNVTSDQPGLGRSGQVRMPPSKIGVLRRRNNRFLMVHEKYVRFASTKHDFLN